MALARGAACFSRGASHMSGLGHGRDGDEVPAPAFELSLECRAARTARRASVAADQAIRYTVYDAKSHSAKENCPSQGEVRVRARNLEHLSNEVTEQAA